MISANQHNKNVVFVWLVTYRQLRDNISLQQTTANIFYWNPLGAPLMCWLYQYVKNHKGVQIQESETTTRIELQYSLTCYYKSSALQANDMDGHHSSIHTCTSNTATTESVNCQIGMASTRQNSVPF